MVAFLLCIPAIIVTSGGYVVGKFYGITITYLLLGMLLVSYSYYLIKKREALSVGSAEKCLLVFEAWGLLYVLLSLTKVNQMMQADLAYDMSFLPRQAVYFFVLPAAILFREKQYMKWVEWFLKEYGEILFWVLFIGHMLYFQSNTLLVIPQLLLCWLSLKLETNQRWRRWIRIVALMVVPLPDYGELSILVIRAIFLIVCIIPKYSSRVLLRIMAVGMLVMIGACFVLPQIFEEKDMPDPNSAWRLRIWKEEETILANTHYLGAGYGTSYPSKTYMSEAKERNEVPYMAQDGYTEYERMFVTAPHNSFISLTMRTGVIGLFLFLLYLGLLFRNLVRHKALPPKSACFALFAGVVVILFNVGLESPGYLLTFVFCLGMCSWEGKKLEVQDRILIENGEMA